MAKIYGHDSYLSQSELRYFIFSVALILLPVAAIFLLIRYATPTVTLAVVLVLLLALLKSLEPLSNLFKSRGMQFYRGNTGEKEVHRILAELPDDYIVFEDVEIGTKKGNIDFVVLAPTGLFLLEVKSHSGNVDYDGYALTLRGKRFRDKNFFRQVHGQIWALKRYLQQAGPAPYIRAAIVFSSPYASMRFGYHPIEGVYVIQKDFLEGLFKQFSLYKYPVPVNLIETELKKAVHL